MIQDMDWEADLARYSSSKPFSHEQSIWAIWVYRFGRRTGELQPGLRQRCYTKIYWLLFRIVETITGISLPKSCKIGPGLRIWHFGNIFIHPESVIGANCTLRQGVTIGNRVENGAAPVIGNNVDFGAYAQILGGITIGNNCKIGAMSVVLCDVPDGATAVGAPARIIHAKSESI
ncbi:serine O-acetyltransferase [Methyloradius palustris]|uniref:Serine acetyltransferase n=1 Tax=Methyloradius palustris TaxID=2778876 RepID=A0A8D5G189_9PROT|nr:serine acetyltransferase [Methyloradius palustris]BCM24248.1 hypothetical protein ZMTM_05070 [Methyloradius palustris]